MGIQHGPKNIKTQCQRILQVAMITSIVAAAVGSSSSAAAQADTVPTPSAAPAIPHCVEQQERSIGRRLLYVTTLDGRINALDIGKSGKLRWSIPTGPGALISSSIHRLELTNNGQFVRMIPSLSGGIYKFDGDSIDPVPITADHLLSSSSKFSDDLVISGGKETRTYGVSVRTGQLLYECSINGCVNSTNEGRAINDTIENLDDASEEHLRDESGYMVAHDPLLDDVMVVRRQTQTVRAVESRTGLERWNFSVGQHELDLVRAEQCHDHQRSDLELAVLDVDIKVVVPEGVICAFSKSEPHSMLWKYKFDHPIVSAWFLNSADKLQSIDLFSSARWLWQHEEYNFDGPEPITAPSIYLGMYEKQLYIQESIQLRREIVDQTQLYQQLTGDTSNMPSIPWRPLAASSNSLVLFQIDQQGLSTGAGGFGGTLPGAAAASNELLPYNEQNFAVAAQSVLNASEFVNGNGFYFYTESQWNKPNEALECSTNEKPLLAIEAAPSGSIQTEETLEASHGNETANVTSNRTINEELGFSLDDIDAPVKVVILSLWFWWKEIVVIAFTSAVLLNIFLNQRNHRVEREYYVIERHVPVQTAIEATEASTQALLGPVVPQQNSVAAVAAQRLNGNATKRSVSESTTHSGEYFTSRFQTEFELVQCLGRGGFGVVFEAKNKLDEIKYAIKRITLPNKEASKKRVMREVRTLASCENENIVRYFHSWVETPPTGWQEEEDRKLLAHELSTSIQIETPDGSTLPSLSDSLVNHNVDKRRQLLSWVADTVNSTACSNIPLKQRVEEEDEDDSSGIIFLSESQSAALHAKEEEDHNDDVEIADCIDERNKRETVTKSVAIDIHSSSSFLFNNLNLSTANHPLSSSFQIESVRSTSSNGSYHDKDNIKQQQHTKRKSLALPLSNNNNAAHTMQATPPSSSSKPNKVYLYIQMQLCRKESLRDWLRDRSIADRIPQTRQIFHQIVSGVEYVHLKGLIHRDLKPSNIFFSQEGRIKIGDFGLVTDMSDLPNLITQCGDPTGLPQCAHHTEQVGTHLYMSPEQLRGQHYDYKVDIYSLGLIYFELHVYFSTEMERIKVLRALRNGKYPEDFDKKFNAEYKLLQKMLSERPEERPNINELKGNILWPESYSAIN